ncbi:hypothetical protein D9M72_545380 [compost metagenome]
MLRWPTFGANCTNNAKAAPYWTRFAAISMIVSAPANVKAFGENEHSMRETAASIEPIVIMRPAP